MLVGGCALSLTLSAFICDSLGGWVFLCGRVIVSCTRAVTVAGWRRRVAATCDDIFVVTAGIDGLAIDRYNVLLIATVCCCGHTIARRCVSGALVVCRCRCRPRATKDNLRLLSASNKSDAGMCDSRWQWRLSTRLLVTHPALVLNVVSAVSWLGSIR